MTRPQFELPSTVPAFFPKGRLTAEAECRAPLADGVRERSRLAKREPVFRAPEPLVRVTASGANVLGRAVPSRTGPHGSRPPLDQCQPVSAVPASVTAPAERPAPTRRSFSRAIKSGRGVLLGGLNIHESSENSSARTPAQD